MECTPDEGFIHLIRRQGKVIHPYLYIAVVQELLLTYLIEVALLVWGGEVILIKTSLTGTFYPGYMGIAIEGYTVGAQAVSTVYGIAHVFLLLKGQTKDQIVADGTIAYLPCL